MPRALVTLAAAAVCLASLSPLAIAGTPTLRDASPGPVRHTVWQPVTGGQNYYGQDGWSQAGPPAGVAPGYGQSNAASAERKSIGSELKKGADKLFNETERALRNTGDAIEGTAKNIGDGVQRAFGGSPSQQVAAPQNNGFVPYSNYGGATAPQNPQNMAPAFGPAAQQYPNQTQGSVAAQSNAQQYNAQQRVQQQPAAGQYAGQERSVLVPQGQQPSTGQGAPGPGGSYGGADQQRLGAQWDTASTGPDLVPPALGDPRGGPSQQSPPAGAQNWDNQNGGGQVAGGGAGQQPSGSQNAGGADQQRQYQQPQNQPQQYGQGQGDGLVSVRQNGGAGRQEQFAGQQNPQRNQTRQQNDAQQQTPPWLQDLDPSRQGGPAQGDAQPPAEGWDAWDNEPARPGSQDGLEAGFARGANRPENPADWGEDIAGPSGEAPPGAREVAEEKPPYGALVFATLVCVFSLGWNVYLGFNYLDARNKYRSALRRTGREYSESLAEA